MNGMLAVVDRTNDQVKSFAAAIKIPDGRMANTLAFFKAVNCLRTNNMNFTQGQCNALKD